ncbi:procollagen-lysine,2-oxoglutarate 5-dioxygenase 1 [Tetranychus urticae]|nr:procollagen-lysine,2-oxoglutarate 5-dioxygenase 1 [Tetranychus urticae]
MKLNDYCPLVICFFSLFLIANGDQSTGSIFPQDLLVFTVATKPTDGFLRLNRSLNLFDHRFEVLGLNEPWVGGDVASTTGGGQKVNLLKKALEKYSKEQNLIILFVDSYDVIINAKREEILDRFNTLGAKVVFSAEDFCWPDPSLAKDYPDKDRDNVGHRYLNSGGFIGWAPQVYEIVSSSAIKDTDDDQLFYTKIYLNNELRTKWSIKLDHKAVIFQNLQGAVGDVQLRFNEDGWASVHNAAFQTEPVVIHGNGLSKVVLNSLGNYIAKAWSTKHGCASCQDNRISLDGLKPDDLPSVLIGIFIIHPTPFIESFFARIVQLSYPKEKISLIIYNKSAYHDKHVADFVKHNTSVYRNVYVLPESVDKDWQARNLALEECVKINCDYYFSIDSDARLNNTKTLISLIEQNRRIIAPLLVRPGKLWSNFWGALSSDGFYSRSHDYIEIIKNEKRGIWNVPHITDCYLINGTVLKEGLAGLTESESDEANMVDAPINKKGDTPDEVGTKKIGEKVKSYYPSYRNDKDPSMDTDMAFSASLRSQGIFIYVSNIEDYGHLVNSEPFETSHLHNDLYEIYNNQYEWAEKYIHPNYSAVLKEDHIIEQPCPDVYWFPIVTPTFCKHLIEEMENYGQWSDGSNYDPRLNGGYESVPTVDIHTNQVGLEQQWLYFLREYVRPVQEKVFIGYFHDPPKATMNFIVRYKPTEQAFLKPHHDTSTYTINIALNRVGIDYEGGGCRFVRYNCSVVSLRQGWTLMHPGKLTHYHEGLTVTSGTRYIMVSFVDP